MKELKISIPEGHEIDKENSTFECIKFKLIKSQLPKKWEDLEEVRGYFVSSLSQVVPFKGKALEKERNIFPTIEQAKACVALAQLLQLRKAWVGDWTPDWTDANVFKHTINVYGTDLVTHAVTFTYSALSFPTYTMAIQFMNEPEIRKLLEIAKPLL